MIPPGNGIVTDLSIENLGRTSLHLLEIWGDPRAPAQRLAAALGHDLPRAGRAHGRVMRNGPATWLIEGDASDLAAALGDDGALVAVGGGLVRVRIAGAGWRALLMEGGLFDAEGEGFTSDCVASTLIEHVTVTMRVESDEACHVYVPASHAEDLLRFWHDSAPVIARMVS